MAARYPGVVGSIHAAVAVVVGHLRVVAGLTHVSSGVIVRRHLRRPLLIERSEVLADVVLSLAL